MFKGNLFVVRGLFCTPNLVIRGLAWKCIGLEPTLSKILGPFFENQLAEEQMFQNACMVDPGEHFAVGGCFLHHRIWWLDGCLEYAFFAALSEHCHKTWDRFLKINSVENKCSKMHVWLIQGNIFCCRWMFLAPRNLVSRRLLWIFIFCSFEWTLPWNVGPFFENQLAKEQMFQNACIVDPGEHFAVGGCFLHNGIWWLDGYLEYAFFCGSELTLPWNVGPFFK